ncbi:MAG: hypothetical protein QM703_02275 [Gemmatales bacterium]
MAPSVIAGRGEGLTRVDEFEIKHVNETGNLLMERSRIIAERVEDGRLAIVGLNYHLSDGAWAVREDRRHRRVGTSVHGDVVRRRSTAPECRP